VRTSNPTSKHIGVDWGFGITTDVGEIGCGGMVLVRKLLENRLRERPRSRWEDNVKIELKQVECKGGD
jgi:hypothetical protein